MSPVRVVLRVIRVLRVEALYAGLLASLAVVAPGCGGSDTASPTVQPAQDGGPTGDDADAATDGATGDDAPTAGSNVVPVIVDKGPSGAESVDVPFISVTLCIPGTTQCVTVDHVSVDTGSSGMRVLASALQGGLALPQATASNGQSLAECFQFADGYTWGSVRNADVRIGGELAANIPIQVIGDTSVPKAPSDCTSSGPSENTVGTFGANGLIGINQIVPDCGSYCASAGSTGGYYACSGSSCANVAVAVAAQVSNPIGSFPIDNNGAALAFPDVSASGASTVAGTLTFGIGTAANNGLGSATLLAVDSSGNLTTKFNGRTMTTSFIDSGSNSYAFDDTAITQCTSYSASGFFCPTTAVTLSAQIVGRNNATADVSFTVANAGTLFGTSSTVFDDLATPGLDASSFDWGFPFFLGRTVFVALSGATTPAGHGPYVAF